MSSVALIILFNHNYELNIDKLKRIYKTRFDDIFFIMPFYKGQEPDVIPVYENSFYFQGYIANALERIKNKKFRHYIIIGDDLILNPRINQENYQSYFGLTNSSGFMPAMFLLNDATQTVPDRPLAPYWPALIDGLKFRVNQRGIEVAKFLPTYDEAVQKLHGHGLIFKPKISWKFLLSPLKKIPLSRSGYEEKKRVSKHYFTNFYQYFLNRRLRYPLIGSYSDICIVPHDSVDSMIRYCGIFAALNLFAEIALPTAFAFSVPQSTKETDLKDRGMTYWNPTTVGQFEAQYQSDFNHLVQHFPDDVLYVHPIKLSRWKITAEKAD